MANDRRRSYRLEEDALGEVRVPAERLWGAQTERARENFPIGVDRFRWGRGVICALGIVKKCAALANRELRQLPEEKVDLIVRAAQEVIDRKLDAEFPLGVFQTGSGTQTNMNANEVIANRAIQLAGGVLGSKSPVHPNDDVNRSHSSNDAFPTVMHIAAVEEIADRLLPAVRSLRAALDAKAKAYAEIVMVGPHSSAGCDAVDRGPADLRLGGAARRRRRDDRAGIAWSVAARDRRHRGRDRAQRSAALWRGRGAQDRRGDRQELRLGAEQVRGPVGA